MDIVQFRGIVKKAFSPFTVLRDLRLSQLKLAIASYPSVFVSYLTTAKMSPHEQNQLIDFFFEQAIGHHGIFASYKPHVDLLYRYHLELWPSSVNLVRTELSKFPEYQFFDPTLLS